MRRFRDEETSPVNNAKYLAILLIVFGAILGVIYLAAEKIVVQKVLTSLAMPVGFCWLGLLTLTYFLIVNNRKGLGLFAMFFTLIFSLCGNGMVAGSLSSTLESPYFDFQLESAPEYDYLVLFGGATSYKRNEQSQLGAHGDRVMVAAEMYHLGKVKKILCTGTRIKLFAIDGVPSPGEQAREILIRAGVPEENLELIEGRNTSEELASLAKRFKNSDAKVGLISSAWHLPRVMRLAENNNLKGDPIPADFITGIPNFTILSLIPSTDAMNANTRILKELLAEQMGQ